MQFIPSAIFKMMNEKILEKKILIHAPVPRVWTSLTDVATMKKWMGESEFDLEIITNWEVGSPFVIKGFHHVRFENRGIVLEYVPDHRVSYNFISSLSRLADKKENYTAVRLELDPQGETTSLSLTIYNFPTETIYQHLNFYWNTTLVLLKRMIES